MVVSLEKGFARSLDAAVAKSASRPEVVRASVVEGREEAMDPGEDFFDLRDKVGVICGEVSESVSYIFDGWCGVASCAVKVWGGILGCEKTLMDRCKALEDEAEPGVAVDSAVGGVEG
jgi:hypothetical protein